MEEHHTTNVPPPAPAANVSVPETAKPNPINLDKNTVSLPSPTQQVESHVGNAEEPATKTKRESVISRNSASVDSLGHTHDTQSTSLGDFSPTNGETADDNGGSEASKKTSVSSQSREGTISDGEKSRGGEAKFRRRFGTAKSPSPNSTLYVNHVNESPDAEDGRSKLPSTFKLKLTNKHSSLANKSRWTKLRTTVKMASVVTQTAKDAKEKRKRKASGLQRQDSFMKKFSTRHGGALKDPEDESSGDDTPQSAEPSRKKPLSQRLVIHPDENFMFYWLAILTLAVLYNLWTAIARQGFPEIRIGYDVIWFTFDGIFDFIYLLDILVQLRTGYLERGLIVYDSKKLAKHYVFSKWFVVDIVSLTPLDFLQVTVGKIIPILRFPRFLKIHRSYLFMYMVETRTIYPNLTRVANLSHLLFLGAHWFAAFYYLISESEGFMGDWAYPVPTGEFASVTRKYLKSLYWSTLTLTTIGDLPPPESNWQWLRKLPDHWYLFTIVSYLIGVFVFATIVGQVGNVITNRNASRLEFERLLDGAKVYMRTHNVPTEMQRRVQRWYNYAWSRGRMNGGGDINSLGLLPDKLKTELALHVNLDTLKKVTIFQECEPEFLHDLMLKMRAFIFTPGDLICRKGEVAREMFIIADGLLEVISDSGEVLTQMGAGDFFGEIGILNLDGGVNRRTADVQSVGYSELFVLSREDVLAALKDHPEAEQILTEHGRKRLIGIRQKNLENEMGKIRKKYTVSQEEANPAPITNLLGVRLRTSRKPKPPTKVSVPAINGEGVKTSPESVRTTGDSINTPSSDGGVDMNEVLSTIKTTLEEKWAKSEKGWEEKVSALMEQNTKKAEQIEELETRLRSLQRALVWKQGEPAGPLPLPSIDV